MISDRQQLEYAYRQWLYAAMGGGQDPEDVATIVRIAREALDARDLALGHVHSVTATLISERADLARLQRMVDTGPWVYRGT